MAPAPATPPARRVVLVSGPPGAGKSTLAGPLAAELGFALLGKDRIKETLHEVLGAPAGPDAPGGPDAPAGPGTRAGTNRPHDCSPPGTPAVSREWSSRLGAAAMEVLWALAADAPAVVLEANFRRSEYQLGRIRALGGRVVEVYCDCPAAVAARRFAERAAGSRHPVHVNPTVTLAELAEYGRPLGVGELVTVDTTAGVDVPALAGLVWARLAAADRPAAPA
jgi:predicted kinase